MDEQLRKRLRYMPLGMLSRWLLALWLGLLGGGKIAADSSVNVPLQHSVYRYVERLEARGLIKGIGDGVKPYTRKEIVDIVNLIHHNFRTTLSPIELSELALLRSEFIIVGKGDGKAVVGGGHSGREQWQYHADEGAIFVDLLARQQSDRFSGRGRLQTEQVFRNQVGGIIRGHIGDKVGFRLAFAQIREQGTRDYTFRQNVYERRLELPQLKGNLADFHEGTAYLSFAAGPVDVQVGKDEVNWGPAPGQNLGLSNNAPSFNMIRLKSRLGAFKLISITAELRPCPDRPDSPLCRGLADSTATYITNRISRTLDREKYLSAHRLEVALAPWLDFGFQEVVIYGDRGPELSYVNPLMFYWAAQSYLGDKDNVMMGLDFDIHPGNGQRYYLAYVVDDLKKAGVFSNDFANKFSLQTGMLWVDPLRLADAEFRAEYLRIEPWIYSHKFPINTFRHFDAPLGHSLGPNSDQWQFSLSKRLNRDMAFNIGFERSRHGDNVLNEDGSIRNVGGDMHYGWRPGDERQSKKFLDGQLMKRTTIRAEVSWRILPDLEMEVEYIQEWGKGVPLPPAWGSGTPLPWRTGYGDGREQHLRFDLRYNYF
jgi:hypothetical protein